MKQRLLNLSFIATAAFFIIALAWFNTVAELQAGWNPVLLGIAFLVAVFGIVFGGIWFFNSH